MAARLKIDSFHRVGEALVKSRQLSIAPKLGRIPISLHDFSTVQKTFSVSGAFRTKIMEFPERVDLVSGKIGAESFVLEALQAKELIANALDSDSLIASLKP